MPGNSWHFMVLFQIDNLYQYIKWKRSNQFQIVQEKIPSESNNSRHNFKNRNEEHKPWQYHNNEVVSGAPDVLMS